MYEQAVRQDPNDPALLWKLGLFPWALLLAGALHALLRRFAAPLADPLFWLLLSSPLLLPAFNLMLDEPALALGLSAVALFLRALDRRCGALAVAAALLAGVAMETKYTAFLIPPVLVGAALPFSLAARRERGQSLLLMTAHAFWRALLLVFLGIFLRSMDKSRTNFTRPNGGR